MVSCLKPSSEMRFPLFSHSFGTAASGLRGRHVIAPQELRAAAGLSTAWAREWEALEETRPTVTGRREPSPGATRCPSQRSQLQPSKAFSVHPWWCGGLSAEMTAWGADGHHQHRSDVCSFNNHSHGRSCQRNLQLPKSATAHAESQAQPVSRERHRQWEVTAQLLRCLQLM